MGRLPKCGRHLWEAEPTRLPGLFDMVNIVFTKKGSVFPRAFCFSLPSAILGVVLKIFDDHSLLGSLAGMQILTNAAAYSGFSLVLGFLFVFRTNMAYNRYWEGTKAGRRMFAEYFDAASTIMAFAKASKASPQVTSNFVHQFVEYLSLLHGASVATLRGDEFMDFITLDGLDDESILELENAVFPVTVIFQWVQQLLVQNLSSGVLNVPAPIVSRAFQEFANGMVAFHDAQRVQSTAFPFPYVQMTTLLLMVHWCVTPVVICMWTNWISWVFIFTLVQVFIFWCLYFTAFEIEFPFKKGHNTYAAEEAHEDFNLELQQLLLTKPAQLRSGEGRKSARFHLMAGTDFAGQTSTAPITLTNEHSTKSFSKKPEVKSLHQTRIVNAAERRQERVQQVRASALRNTTRGHSTAHVNGMHDFSQSSRGEQSARPWQQQCAGFVEQPSAAVVLAAAVAEATADVVAATHSTMFSLNSNEAPLIADALSTSTHIKHHSLEIPSQRHRSPKFLGSDGATASTSGAPDTLPDSIGIRGATSDHGSPNWPDGALSVTRADPLALPRENLPEPRQLSRPVHDEGRASP